MLLLPLPTLLLFATVLQAAVRQPVSGRVTDAQGTAIGYATVVLLHEGVQNAGTTSDADGRFVLTAAAGDYTLSVRCMGFDPAQRAVVVGEYPVLTGDIRLETAAVRIGEVVVSTGGIERKADRFVMEVGGDAAIGKDGAELLSQAPGVWLDEQRLSVNGAAGTKVYVDDRELRLEGEKLTAYLRTLRAEEIRRVEVIPQAGADYSADTRGGVIRITLRKRLNDGMNGSITAATSQSQRLSHYAPSATLSFRHGGWMVSASGSGSFVTRGETEFLETRNYADGATRFSSPSLTDMRQNYGTGRLSIVREIGSRHSLGAEAEYTAQGGNAPVEATTELERNGTVQYSRSEYSQRSREKTFSATLNYIFRPDTLGTALKVIADYMHKKAGADNDYVTRFQSAQMLRDTTYRNHTASVYDVLSADAAFEKPLGGGMHLKAGARYTYTHTRDTARYEGLSTAMWQPRPEYGRKLDYTEHIGALYAIFSADVGRWSLSGGLRGEYARTLGRDDGINRSYTDLFPNASITFSFNSMRTWMLNGQYARNIERPNFWSLNPNRIQLSDYSYMMGNPNLKPTYIHRFSLTLIFRYRYTFTVGGNLHRDLIREERLTDPVSSDVSYILPQNHYTEDHWFVALNLPFRPTKWWTLTANFVGVKQDIRTERTAAEATHYLYFAGVVSGFSLPAKFHIELSYNGASRLWSGNSTVDPRHTVSIAVKKRLAGDRLTIAASVRNLFDARSGYTSHTEGFDSATVGGEAWQSRSFRFSVSWNFRSGKNFKEHRLESASSEEKARLKKPSAQ